MDTKFPHIQFNTCKYIIRVQDDLNKTHSLEDKVQEHVYKDNIVKLDSRQPKLYWDTKDNSNKVELIYPPKCMQIVDLLSDNSMHTYKSLVAMVVSNTLTQYATICNNKYPAA